MARQPLVGVKATVRAGSVASLARYWSSRGVSYNQVVSRVHKKFRNVSMQWIYKWASYWNKVHSKDIDFTKKNWDKPLDVKALPSLKSSPKAVRAQVRIRAKHPVSGRKQEYHFTIDVSGSLTRKQFLDEIKRKLIDHFLYYYERRGIREQNIQRLISTLQITSLEGI